MQHACGLFPSPTSCSHTFLPQLTQYGDRACRTCSASHLLFCWGDVYSTGVLIQHAAPVTPGFLRSGSVESAPAISHSTNFFLGSEVCLLCQPLCLVTSHSSKHSPPAWEPRLLWGKQAHYVANVTICAISGGAAGQWGEFPSPSAEICKYTEPISTTVDSAANPRSVTKTTTTSWKHTAVKHRGRGKRFPPGPRFE